MLAALLCYSCLLTSLDAAGRQDASDATLETLKAIPHAISTQAQILVDGCSFAGTGNVLKVQAMLHHCNDHIEKPKEGSKEEGGGKEDDTFQAFAVLAIALVAMGEDVGAEMSLRQFNHLASVSTANIDKPY